MTELDAMATRCPAALTCAVETLGVSYEGRDIKVLRVSKNNHFMTLKFEEKKSKYHIVGNKSLYEVNTCLVSLRCDIYNII